MDKLRIKNRDRFLRSFCRTVEESRFFTRFGFGKGEYAGRRLRGGFLLYRRRRGIFSLFALTLWGTFSREEGRDVLQLRFGRCVPVAILWCLWCAWMLLAGVLLVAFSHVLALWFLVPALLCALPLFLFSKREKARLIAFVKRIED